MKNVLIACSVLVLCLADGEASGKSRCRQAESTCCQTTRWYKAKDGTYREMLPYATALSRAEDADDLEISLKDVRDKLDVAVAESEAVKAETLAVRSALEARIAELQQQLDAERVQVAVQTERAEMAEAAHKLAVESVAQQRDEMERAQKSLADVQSELQTVSAERAELKTAKAEMEQQLSDLAAAKTAAEEAQKRAEDELRKVRQDGAETKKPEIQEEQSKDDANPSGGDPGAAAGASAGSSPAPVSGN